MGEPPTDFESELTENNSDFVNHEWYMSWLLLLQFLAWFIIPILVGLLIYVGQKELERRKEQLSARAELLWHTEEKQQQHLYDAFIEIGLDHDSAITRTISLLSDWDEMADNIRGSQ